MQTVLVSENQTLRITGTNITIEIVDAAPRTKRGPKALPQASISSPSLHQPILKLMRKARAPMTAVAIRESILPQFKGATTNTVAWALVELQNENCQRGKNRPKTGPIVKRDDGAYALRS